MKSTNLARLTFNGEKTVRSKASNPRTRKGEERSFGAICRDQTSAGDAEVRLDSGTPGTLASSNNYMFRSHPWEQSCCWSFLFVFCFQAWKPKGRSWQWPRSWLLVPWRNTWHVKDGVGQGLGHSPNSSGIQPSTSPGMFLLSPLPTQEIRWLWSLQSLRAHPISALLKMKYIFKKIYQTTFKWMCRCFHQLMLGVNHSQGVLGWESDAERKLIPP